MANPINPDEYTLCRGIPVKKTHIAFIEQTTGFHLVPDSDPKQQEELDLALARFRKQNQGRSPKGEMIWTDEAFYHYTEIPVPVGIYIPGMPTIETHEISKPIWFRKARNMIRGRTN